MITVYTEGVNKGPKSFPDCTILFDDMQSGTDYFIEEQGTSAYKGSTVRLIKMRIANPDMLDDVQPLDDTMHVYDWIPDQPVTAHAVTIGQKPADWELHWRDKYYVKLMFEGYTWYQAVELPTWDPLQQYYTVDYQMQHLFWTLSGGFFGASTWYSRYWGYDRSCSCAAVCFPALQVSYTGDERNQYYYRSDGVDGSMLERAGAYAYFYEETVDMANQYTPTFGLQFCSFNYSDHQYIGIAIIKYGVDGTVLSARLSAVSDLFFRGRLPKIKHGAASEPAGGGGSFTNVFNSVSIPAIPSALSTANFAAGLKIRILDEANVGNLFKKLWPTEFWDRWKYHTYNPLSAIISLHLLPTQITGTSSTKMTVSGAEITGVTNMLAPSRLVDRDCGSVDVPEYYGSRLDYAPYTTLSLYLPFCGTYPIDTSQCMGGSLHVSYRFDLATGDCLAFVEATNRDGLTTVIMTAKGNAAYRVPVCGNDGGGMGMLSALATMIGGGVQLATGNIAGGAMQMLSGGIQGLSNKHTTMHQSVQGSASAYGILQPYLTISRAVQHRPDNYAYVQGDPAELGGTVGTVNDIYDVSGYARYTAVDLSGIVGATDAELEQIREYLESGVYV